MAQLIDADERTVQALARQGLMVREGFGRFRLVSSIQLYVAHLRKIAAGRGDDANVGRLNEERLMAAKLNRQTKEAEFRKTTGDLLEMGEVESVLNELMLTVRGMVEKWPEEMRLLLPGLTDADAIRMKEATRDFLNDEVMKAIQKTGMHPDITKIVKARKKSGGTSSPSDADDSDDD